MIIYLQMELQALMDNVALLSHPLFLSLILLFPTIIWLKNIAKPKGKKKLNNLPPSPPKLPIIGNIHQFGKLPHRSLRHLSNKYGSLLLLQLGHNPTLVVSSPDLAKELFKNHDIAFSNRPNTTAGNILFYGCKSFAFAPYGEYWRQVRKISVVEIFSLRRVHTYFQSIREEEVEVLMNKLRHAASLEGDARRINLSEMLMAASINIISRSVLSRRIDGEGEGGSNSRFGELTRRVMALLTKYCVGDLFPYLWWMDVVSGTISNLKSVSRELDAYLDQIIEEHKALTSDHDHKKDFVSIILQLQKDGMLEMELTQDNIKAIILDMLVGGTDTVATTMEWLMAELIKNPNVMRKVQEEVRNVVGFNKPKVEVDDINKMIYLKCVIKETLRLHSSALIPRQTSVTTLKLGGYDIPPNITVLINAFAIQRDPSWWEKAEEFIPERFENSSADYKGQDFQFIPFGSGRRGCPGMPFGVASVEYVIANLVYFFDWMLPEGEIVENLDMAELGGLNVNKKLPLHVVPIIAGLSS